MDEIQEKKLQVRNDMKKMFESFSKKELAKKISQIEHRLFEFANFQEAKIPLLYINSGCEIDTGNIIKRCLTYNKVVVLPVFTKEKHKVKFFKIDNLKTDLKTGNGDSLEPDPGKCQIVPIECIDIALIPSLALDEKGGRIGAGNGNYDRLISKLPITARKVSLALEEQIIPQVPMASHDKYMDIIITEKRIIYKI